MTRHEFIVEGDPLVISRIRMKPGKFCDNSERVKLFWKNTLNNQFEGCDKLGRQPICISALFYCPNPQNISLSKRSTFEDKICSVGPQISRMVKFLLTICEGIVYDSDTKVAKVEASKFYSEKPRCVFTVTDLG